MSSACGQSELLSGGCVRCSGTNSSPSAWPCQRCCTTRTAGCTPRMALHGARAQPPRPGLRSARRTPRHGARSLLSPPARSSSPCWTRTMTCWSWVVGEGQRGPQERVLQRIVEPIVETFVPEPALDVLVPQMVGPVGGRPQDL